MFRNPFRRHRHPDTPQVEQAAQDLERTKAELQATRAETPYYESLARDLREIRERNHLAESFIRAAGGRPRHG